MQEPTCQTGVSVQSHDQWVASMERESTVRRLQSDLNVFQANGKLFTTEKSVELFKRNWSLEDTHEVR